MRRLHLVPLALAMVMLICPDVQAASGKATISGMRTSYTGALNYMQSILILSNVSESTVHVTVTFVKQDGSILADDGLSTSGNITATNPGSNYNDNIANASVEFDMAPSTTTQIQLQIKQPAIYWSCYTTVEWSNTGINPNTALVGSAFVHSQFPNANLSVVHSLSVNNGIPF